MQAVPGGANYWDLGHLEGHAVLTYYFECDYGVGEERLHLPIPEETMDELEKLIGNGESTITVGKELKVSENYRTAGSSCFVKLTCNQDLDTVLAAREIATTLAIGFAEQGYEQAQYALDRISGVEATPPAPLEVVSGEAREEVETDPEPDRKQKPKKGSKRPVLKGKPKFRR